ncbi:MAG: hypothetical protein JNM27_19080 [Leptospirales bacterium]|nr:hypothetical protein [Leptospirales bacterium]
MVETFEGAPSKAGFLSGLKPFAGTEAENITPPSPTTASRIELGSGSQKCSVELKKSYSYQASQDGDFRNNGNVRIVANSSNPGTYTFLQIGRTAEIDASYNATVANGKLIVERYLAKDNLEFTCSPEGISGTIASAKVEVNVLISK